LLAVLLVTEVAVIVIFSLADLGNPGGGSVSFDTFSPRQPVRVGHRRAAGPRRAGFVGFESSVVFSEEARDRQRTVPIATYLSVALIAVLYAFASWAMRRGHRPGQGR